MGGSAEGECVWCDVVCIEDLADADRFCEVGLRLVRQQDAEMAAAVAGLEAACDFGAQFYYLSCDMAAVTGSSSVVPICAAGSA